MVCLMGGCLLSTTWERRAVDMTDFEILSLVISILSMGIGIVTVLLKLFAFLDSRYKRK